MAASVLSPKSKEARQAAGQCIRCGVDTGGKAYCPKHAEEQNESRRKSSVKRRAAGLCTKSGCKNKAIPNHSVCQKHSDEASAVVMQKYADRRAKGLCVVCEEPAIPGQVQCKKHATEKAEYHSQLYNTRKAAGKCVTCGKPRGEGGTEIFCAVHRQDACDRAKLNWLKLKLAAFDRYGGRFCALCPEKDVEILEIDHIAGGGCKKRRDDKIVNIYAWLKRHDYPPGHRVLCPTCNKKEYIRKKKEAANVNKA